MILFWLVAGILAAIIVAALARPLLARAAADGDDRLAYDLAIYRDQLAEVERALAGGEVSATEAAASQGEIGRRILAAADRAETASPPAGARKFLAVALALLLPIGALGLYGWHGAPKLPGQPLAERPPAAADGTAQHLEEATAALIRRLEERPDDLEGWEMLARTLVRARRYTEGAEAYRRRLGLGGDRPDLQSAYGEALTMAADGQVTPAAREAFAKAPDDPRARFFLAEAALQAGDLATALAGMAALEAAAPPGAPWRPVVRQRIVDIARQLGVAAPPAPTTEAPAAGVPAGGEAILNLPPEERTKAIRAMVDNLEQRLQVDPNDRTGWHRLAQAWRVLDEPARAEAALTRAVAAFPDDPEMLLDLASAQLETAGGEETLPPAFLATIRTAARLVPDHPQVLWYLGRAAADGGDAAAARRLWRRLLDRLPADAPARLEVEGRLAALPKDSLDSQ